MAEIYSFKTLAPPSDSHKIPVQMTERNGRIWAGLLAELDCLRL